MPAPAPEAADPRRWSRHSSEVLAFGSDFGQRHPATYRILLTPPFDTVSLKFIGDKIAFGAQPDLVHDVRVRQALALTMDRSAMVRRALRIMGERTGTGPCREVL